MNYPLLRNEARRLLELHGQEIMDTPPEPAFERVVRIAARFFAMPMAAVSFVGEYRVWRKASVGLAQRETSREAAFCSRAILQKKVLVVRDATLDDRFRNSPLVHGPEHVRFYAGAPLFTAQGAALGTLCVVDTTRREFTREDEGTLADLAALVVDELELRRLNARLRAEVDGGRRAQRTLTRQHRLLRRLSDSQEDRVSLRTHELLRANEALRAEIARCERADAALRQAKEEAERANHAKSEFLSHMSHELRTPLDAILGFGRILQGPLSEAAQRDCANHVVTAGSHLLSLINEVLDLARIEAGYIELSLEPVRVAEVIGETLDLIRPLAAERGITVQLAGTDGGSRAILADRQRFKQVLLNLFSNALKYSPAGSRVIVRCRTERAGTLRLSVVDQGPGFTREQAGRLFVAFDRLGAERSGVRGTGLGLALSKRLIEAMHGDIGIQTVPGRGSAFWVRLPLSRAEPSAVREPAAESPSAVPGCLPAACPPFRSMSVADGFSGMKLLIVDDEAANVALLEYILREAGYTRLRCVSDSRLAMAAFQDFQPDLILLDLMMPRVSGFEIMAQLRQVIPPGDILPILVLTADVNTESKHQALLAGASDFLTKPFDPVEALLRIRHLLQLRAQHRQLTRQNDVLEDTAHARTGELRRTLSRLEETLHQLRSTQQQVIQHERLSALGSMAAGLAHDFNNSLSLILGYSELLLGELAATPYRQKSDECLGMVMTAAQDAARMFGRLRSIFRQADHDREWRPVDLNTLVEQAAALTRPRWHGQALGQGVTITLRTVPAAEMPTLLADAAELREMLTNLIFNAVDALPQGGEITLRTRAAAGEVVLEVQDTGTGMDEETRRRCLEPFFTTKGQKGTGLGLAMVYGTMQRHGGRIDLQSAPGKGTTFTFLLPLQPPTAAAGLPANLPAPEAQRPWRILVVDDQPVFVKILRHYLAHDLHAVETAQDGREALERVRARTFDLVITDRAMPHMHGEELAAAIKRIAPRTRIILLTGYSGEEAREPSPWVDAVVLKPVTHAALRALIGQTMAGYQPARCAKRAAKSCRRPVALQKLKL